MNWRLICPIYQVPGHTYIHTKQQQNVILGILIKKSGVGHMPIIPAFKKLRQEGHKIRGQTPKSNFCMCMCISVFMLLQVQEASPIVVLLVPLF